VVSCHDNLHDTILPRIKRAGGEIGNFCQTSSVARSDENDERFAKRKLRLPGDIGHVEELIVETESDIVVVDPLSSFCRTASDFTTTLELLDDLASRIGIPIIATVPAKTWRREFGGFESKPIYPDGPARCVWSIVADADDPDLKLFVPTRMTFAVPREGLAFRIVEGRIAWEPLPESLKRELDDPVAWLWAVLQEGEMRGAKLQQQAKEFGFTEKMLRRARKVLDVQVRRKGTGENTTSIWSLPQGDAQSEAERIAVVAPDREPQARLAGPEQAAQLGS
jgi:hypothetical protein